MKGCQFENRSFTVGGSSRAFDENYDRIFARRDSSVGRAPDVNPEVSGSSPDRGSVPQPQSATPTWFYAILRTELTGGALLAQLAHAAREAKGPAPTEDERDAILVATKDQMEKAAEALTEAGIDFKRIVETDGELKGSMPVIAFSCSNILREQLVAPILKDQLGLKLWRKPKLTVDTVVAAIDGMPKDEAKKFLEELMRRAGAYT